MIKDNIQSVKQRITQAALRSGRSPEDIRLIAVSKLIEPERIREAVEAGILDLGENYYQEARDKVPLFPPEVRWHFIGQLQTNKAKYVAGHFALIHSVDSLELARELGRRASANGTVQPILLEVKLDPAATKFGVSAESLMSLVDSASALPGIEIRGLMGMAPFADNPEASRPYFAHLRGLFDMLPKEMAHDISMGMTADFEVAVEEGATMVRIGTAIFGSRH